MILARATLALCLLSGCSDGVEDLRDGGVRPSDDGTGIDDAEADSGDSRADVGTSSDFGDASLGDGDAGRTYAAPCAIDPLKHRAADIDLAPSTRTRVEVRVHSPEGEARVNGIEIMSDDPLYRFVAADVSGDPGGPGRLMEVPPFPAKLRARDFIVGSVRTLGSYIVDPIFSGREELVTFDVDVHRVAGRITVNGENVQGFGFVFLRSARTGDQFLVRTNATTAQGETFYAMDVPADTYDIGVDARQACQLGIYACNRQIVRRGIDIDGPQTLDLDLEVRAISGEVLFDGREPPEVPARPRRASLFFQRPDGIDLARVELPPVGPAAFQVLLSPGTYEVTWSGGADGTDLPFGNALLNPRLEVQTSTSVVIDVETVVLDLDLRINGEPLERSWATFTIVDLLERSGLLGTRVFPTTSPVRTTAFSGRKDVVIRVVLGPDPLDPLSRVLVAEDVDLGEDRSLAFDLAAEEIALRLTLNGELLPEAEMPGLRGGILTEASGAAKPIPPEGPSRLDLRLLQGRVELTYTPPADCVPSADRVPCNSIPLEPILVTETSTSFVRELRPDGAAVSLPVEVGVASSAGALSSDDSWRLTLGTPAEVLETTTRYFPAQTTIGFIAPGGCDLAGPTSCGTGFHIGCTLTPR